MVQALHTDKLLEHLKRAPSFRRRTAVGHSQERALGASVALSLGVEGALVRLVALVVRRRPCHAEQLRDDKSKSHAYDTPCLLYTSDAADE